MSDAAGPGRQDRDPAHVGKVVQTPHTCGGEPRLEGTRLTTACLRAVFVRSGSIAVVLEHYPYLQHEDVEAALRFELGEGRSKRVQNAVKQMREALDELEEMF